MIRTLQENLNKLGYDAGREDGILGTQTHRALKRYRAKQAPGASESGTIERVLQETLGNDAPHFRSDGC
ncbi:peptidoglycan-binding protein [Rhizobium leguminosarum]|uniref:peptidoglycan-binding domain-containing protein n=1 Tax=Rhizobium leguminosarum TaxID=384 RepID=UPI003F975F02